jgi:hypothetical protein
MLAGPGWASARVPKKAVLLDSLEGALRHLSETG